MVTTTTSYSDSIHRADPGQGYDGVVKVSVAGHYGTGVLLYDGRAILTAAHLFSAGATSATVSFQTLVSSQSLSSSQVLVHPGYDALNVDLDLALVWLSAPAPVSAERYNIYRTGDEIGQSMTLVGYGMPGSGTTGQLDSFGFPRPRLKASNQFDADMLTLKTYLGDNLPIHPTGDGQLVADFDDGTSSHDALGQLINRGGLGLGASEGSIATGDSGGPAFINGQVAGIASFTASLVNGSITPDVDSVSNSSFGEVAAWQRVSHSQQWIDLSLRARYADAPARPEDVKKQVQEGASGTSLAYFLLEFSGIRASANETISVDFMTRDGTATAGEDYLAVSGTLKLYPGEDRTVIPVEILGDNMPEADETFYLDVTNPVGGSFGDGVVKLTAIRTILNDDGVIT